MSSNDTGPSGHATPADAAKRGRRRGGAARSDTPPDKETGPTAVPLEGPPGAVLERLRDRIRDVVRELDALREENSRLSQHVTTLQEQAEGAADPALLRLDESPAALRAKIEGFIEALDTYLDAEAR